MSKRVIYEIIVAVVVLAIGFGLGVLGSAKSPSLGSTTYDVLHQVGDLRQGMADTLMMSNGSFVGPINTSQSAVFSGAVTGITTSTLTTLSVQATTHSSVKVGSNTSTGCLELGDTAGSATVYITASGATVSATTTKPTNCL